MIRLLEPGQEGFLTSLCAGEPFGCRIITTARAYGLAGRPAEFWAQVVQGVPCAALCRVDGDFTLCAAPGADWEELRQFLDAAGFRSVFSPVFPAQEGDGPVMRWEGRPAAEDGGFCRPEPRRLLRLLSLCGMASQEDAALYVDLSYKIRHGLIRAAGVEDSRGALLSCAMTIAESDDTAVIGGVATAPGSRRRGFASGLVTALASQLEKEGKRPYLFCKPQLAPFYQKSGFHTAGGWQQSGDCSREPPGVK